MTEKYAIIKTKTIHHPATEGDERSRTNTGHGYPAQPAYTTNVEEFHPFTTKEKWESWIKDHQHSAYYGGESETFKAIIYREAEITTSVEININ